MADPNQQNQGGAGGGLPTGGQAEGDRTFGGEAPDESGLGAGAGPGTTSEGGGLPTGGQAEGDRATVDQDLQNRKQT